MELLPIKEPLARNFYAEMCRIEHWDVRTLRQKVGSMLYQRTALAKRPQSLIAEEISQMRDGKLTPDIVFRDPYFLDLLGLQGVFSERDLESAILREIEGVLLELGAGFTFVARQKRMSVGRDDFHLDLLFFHRHLRRLVAVELKLEAFQPAHIGQMELYLRWLDKHERAPGEESPIGLIKWERRHEQAEQSPDSQQHRRVSSKNLEDHAPSAPWYPRRAFVYKVGADRSPRRRLRAGGRAAPKSKIQNPQSSRDQSRESSATAAKPLIQNPKSPPASPATLSRRSREARRRTSNPSFKIHHSKFSYPPFPLLQSLRQSVVQDSLK